MPVKPRPRNPEAKGKIRLSEKDKQIFDMLYACDGIMAIRQIKELFYPDNKDESGVRSRMRKLFDWKYLNQPDENQIRHVPEHIYWLDVDGYKVVYGRMGRVVTQNDIPRLKKIATFNPWILEHHLEVVDVRIKFMQTAQAHEEIELLRWVGERNFRQWKMKATFKDAHNQTASKIVIPDGFFSLRTPSGVAHYLLEVDRGKESHTVIEADKIRAGVNLLTSKVYQYYLAATTGRYLIITTSWPRIELMRQYTRQAGAAEAYYFSTLDDVLNSQSPITEPIWQMANKSQKVRLPW